MFQKAIVSVVCSLLSNINLTIENKNKLSSRILDVLGALPLSEIIMKNDDGELVIEGKVVDVEKAKQLNASANTALDNQVEILIREQVAYEAITNGVHKFNGDSGQMFMRAALWWEQQREKHLKFLAGRSSS